MIDTIATTIRPFRADDADYAAVVAVHNRSLPDYAETVEDWRHWDSSRAAHCVCERFVAERGGEVVGYGHIHQWQGMYHPRKYHIDIKVVPEARGEGIGARFYEHLLARLDERQALLARTELREDWDVSLAFVARRGFEEEMRTWESRLDVPAFDPSPFAGQIERVLADGFEIVSLAEYMERQPDYRRRLYEAIPGDMIYDVPRPDEYTQPEYESWQQQVFTDKNLYPEAYFLALHQGEIAAVSQLWHSKKPEMLYTGLTGTRRAYRRRGLALALKLRAIAFARATGVREIRTGNASTNRAMLSINEALGFVKQPAWIEFRRVYREE